MKINSPPAVVSRLVAVFGGLLAVGCSDQLLTPRNDGADDSFIPWVLQSSGSQALMMQGETCLQHPDCEEVSNHCVCTLEGIGVEVQGGAGDPGTLITFPDPPGWPSPDWDDWVIPPGGGGMPPNDPETACDPYAITAGCKWTATLECPSDVTRGTSGTCYFSISPSSALDYISGWYFIGDNVTTVTSSASSSWGASWSKVASSGLSSWLSAAKRRSYRKSLSHHAAAQLGRGPRVTASLPVRWTFPRVAHPSV